MPTITQENAIDHLRSYTAGLAGGTLRLVQEGDQMQDLEGRPLATRGPTIIDQAGAFLILAQMVCQERLFGVEVVIGRDGSIEMLDDYLAD